MKLNKIVLSVLLLGMTMISCSDSNENGLANNTNIVKFSSSIAGQDVKTRAAGTTWAPNDEIGVFMKTGAGLNTIVGEAENKKYMTTGDGQFAPPTTSDAIYFPDGQNVDFVAYYPYTATLTNNTYKVDVSSQASQEAIDLLYSDNAVEKQKGDAVTLNFKHELAKIVFNVTGVAPITSLDDLKIVVTNMKVKADYNLADKSLVEASDIANIELKTTTSGLTAVSEGIILPTAAATRKFTFSWTVAGETKTFDWDASNQSFEKGKKNIYTVVFSDLGVVVEAQSTIEDWGTGSSENIDINAGGAAGNGTQANPYSVAEVTSKVGQTAKWVEGYIVGSTSVTKMIGTAVKTNILLAASANETDEAKCIIVDIDNSVVQKNLDIVDNPTLVGTKVKVQGDIVNNIFGGALAMTTIIGQEGGAEVEMETYQIFKETFGTLETPNEINPYTSAPLDKFPSFDMKDPITYTTGTTKVDLRYITAIPADGFTVWFPTHSGTEDKNRTLIIDGIESEGYTDLELSYDFLGGVATTTYNTLILKCDGNEVALPSEAVGTKEVFKNIKVTISAGTKKIEFIHSHLKHNVADKHMRLDNIIITGKK